MGQRRRAMLIATSTRWILPKITMLCLLLCLKLFERVLLFLSSACVCVCMCMCVCVVLDNALSRKEREKAQMKKMAVRLLAEAAGASLFCLSEVSDIRCARWC